MASDLEAVCRSEAQRVVFALRGNKRFGNRSWRDLEDSSPLRQLCAWRLYGCLAEPLLRVIRSADFAGPATFVALEATQHIVVALCEEQRRPEGLREKDGGARMVDQLSKCEDFLIVRWAVCEDRVRAFTQVLKYWGHYRQSHTLRASAQATLQRMLDFALVDLTSPARADFLRAILGMMASDAEPGMPIERALLYLRCIQRLVMHPTSRRWAMSEQGKFMQNDIPLLLLSFCKLFPGSSPLLLESLYDLLEPSLVQTIWFSFDGDWRRPPLLEQMAGKAVQLVTERPPSSERPLPAHLMQLCSAVLTRIVRAFEDLHEGDKMATAELERVQKQWQLRRELWELMNKIEESPKKARAALEKSPLFEVVPVPPGASGEASEEWVFKLIWLFRAVHFVVPYSAVGEFFGQPKEDQSYLIGTAQVNHLELRRSTPAVRAAKLLLLIFRYATLRQRLPEALCQTVADANLLTVETFSTLGDTIAAVKTTLKAIIPDQTKFGPDEPAQELALASLAAVWKTCSTMQDHFAARRAKMEEDPSKVPEIPGEDHAEFRQQFIARHPDVVLPHHREPHRKFVERLQRDFLVHGAVNFYEVGEMRTRNEQIAQKSGLSRNAEDLLKVVQIDQPQVAASESQVMDKLHAFFVALEYLNICEFSYKAGPLQYLSDLEEWRHENRGLALLLAADSLIRKKVYRLNSDRKQTYGTFSAALLEVLTNHKQLWNDARSRQWRKSKELVEWSRRCGLALDALAYVALSFAHEQSSRWQLALALPMHCQLGASGFGVALAACEKAQLWTQALHLQNQLQERPLVRSPAVEFDFPQGDRDLQWSKILRDSTLVLKTAESRSVDLNLLMLNSLLSTFSQAMKWTLALQLLQGGPDAVGLSAVLASCEEGGAPALPAHQLLAATRLSSRPPHKRPAERQWGAELMRIQELQNRGYDPKAAAFKRHALAPAIRRLGRPTGGQHVETNLLDFGLFTREALGTLLADNVLLTSRTQWKLADFNLATTFDPNEYMAEHVGTTPFKAPEVEDMKYTEKCDIYSMGILFIALATGKRYWRPESLEDEEDKLVAEELLSEKTWKDAELGKPALDFAKCSSLSGQASALLQRLGQSFRDVLEFTLASEGGATFAADGLEQLLRLALQLARPEADRAAESLFFFASEVFHDAHSDGQMLARGASCLRALVHTARASANSMPSWSTKHVHLLVYLTVQFAVYGVLEKALPPMDAQTRKLLLCPSLVVDPPTGVVYNFLRKISTAPFKMLSFAELEGPTDPQGSSVRSASAPVHAEEESPPPPVPQRLKSAGALRNGIQEVREVPEADSVPSEDSNEAVEDVFANPLSRPVMKLLFFAAFDVAFTVRFNAQTGDVLDAEPLRQYVLYAEGAPEGFVNPLVDFGSHHLLEMLDVGVDASALQTCYNLHREQGEWKLGWKKKMIDAMIQFGHSALVVLKPQGARPQTIQWFRSQWLTVGKAKAR
eukprot:g3311.t1